MLKKAKRKRKVFYNKFFYAYQKKLGYTFFTSN